jgi:site-specific recombinase XerD
MGFAQIVRRPTREAMHLSSSQAFSSSRVLNRSRGVKKRVHVSRRKGGSRQCIRSGDELREFPKLRTESTGLFVFMTERGAPFTPDSFDWIVKRAGERANHPFPIHAYLQHRAGYKLAADAHDTRSIQDYLGHREIRHTVRYTALSPEPFRDFWRD